jgi:hypothetical protein
VRLIFFNIIQNFISLNSFHFDLIEKLGKWKKLITSLSGEMAEISARNRNLEAKLVATKLKHSQDQLTLENRLQESMSFNQKLLIESIEKNAEIRGLKEKLSKFQDQDKENCIKIMSESITEISKNTVKRSSNANKQYKLLIHHHSRRAELSELELKQESDKRIESELKEPNMWTPNKYVKPAISIKNFELDHNYNNTLKKNNVTIFSPDKSFLSPLNKRKRIDFVDRRELARKVHIAVVCQGISYKKFAFKNKIKPKELVELLEDQTPWKCLNKVKRRLYINIDTYIHSLNIPAAVEVVMGKPAKNNDGSLNTGIVVMQIKYFLFKWRVSQKLFAKKHLCMKKRFKQLLKEPVAWEKCNEDARNFYSMCYEWASAGEKAAAELKNELKSYFKLVEKKHFRQLNSKSEKAVAYRHTK